jgi:hypothetical protein
LLIPPIEDSVGQRVVGVIDGRGLDASLVQPSASLADNGMSS